MNCTKSSPISKTLSLDDLGNQIRNILLLIWTHSWQLCPYSWPVPMRLSYSMLAAHLRTRDAWDEDYSCCHGGTTLLFRSWFPQARPSPVPGSSSSAYTENTSPQYLLVTYKQWPSCMLLLRTLHNLVSFLFLLPSAKHCAGLTYLNQVKRIGQIFNLLQKNCVTIHYKYDGQSS